ncbi:MAG: GNAT family N-acetyltransferase [Rubricoccaceae bacterium]
MPVSLVSASTVRPLRTRVLRPAFPPGTFATYPEDTAVETLHVAATDDAGEVLAVATFYPEPPPASLRTVLPAGAFRPGASWRLRGMASAEAVRGQGHGAAVLRAGLEAIAARAGHFLWCNARTGAIGFYTRLGLRAEGPEFDIAGVGPHRVMWTPVTPPGEAGLGPG